MLRAHLLNYHLHELDQCGNNQDKHDGLEKFHLVGDEQVVLNEPGAQRSKGHHKDNGNTHAEG
jgi:hypothetical protein